jgi:hypothetical protein
MAGELCTRIPLTSIVLGSMHIILRTEREQRLTSDPIEIYKSFSKRLQVATMEPMVAWDVNPTTPQTPYSSLGRRI